MTPVVLGLALAIPLASFTRGARPGSLSRAPGCWERREAAYAAGHAGGHRRGPRISSPPADPVHALFAEPEFLAAHRAMLPPPRRSGDPYDAALLIARAKLDDSSTFADAIALLTKSELAAALADAACLDRLAALSGD